ncbi:c6353cef-bfcd-4023-ae6b-d6a8bcf6624b [Sclerotinia trifoliorum]|uniref:C6353cef-bfcd-4023-ae6b-d6a8bcf6624b n=1 Tax=Sclerotinia trifoliorum TaxID=28548 RepID=A0A8H2ZMW9_9HELO|nr:c6353cef-bfcd-4023-ae6b-d6a8bcf6624b [Sclerotinia trifoliorum]
MSTSQPSQFTQPDPANPRTTPLLHNASLAALIICPIVMMIPPRKMDVYTFALMGTTFIGGNHLAYEYTGVSMMTRIQNRVASFSGTELPEKAKETQRRIREAQEKKRMEESGKFVGTIFKSQEGAKGEGVLEALEKRSAGQSTVKKVQGEGKESVLEKIWLGGEGKDWKEKRDQKEKEALEAGKGYGDLIMEQIWEVWNGGKKKVEEVKEVDEKVVEGKKK